MSKGRAKRPKRFRKAKAAEEKKIDQTAEKLYLQRRALLPYRNRSNTFGAASQVRVIDPKTGEVTREFAPSRYNPITGQDDEPND